MRGTLSQPTRPETLVAHPVFGRSPASVRKQFPRSQRSLGLCIRLAVTAAIFFAPLACSEVDQAADALHGVGKAQDDRAALEIVFHWPEDPSHPVLEISIESPDTSGTILIELMPELAPATVAKVIELANEGFYDGTTFHRVIPGFMIQCGDPNSRDRDPNNDGKGAPGRRLHDEFGEAPFLRGVVGMGNAGRRNSTSTQFFIMQVDNQNLDGHYTAIGRVLSGLDLVDDLMKAAIDRMGRWGPKDRPIENIVMTKVHTIGQVSAIRAALQLEAQTASASKFESTDVALRETDATNPPRPPAALGANDD